MKLYNLIFICLPAMILAEKNASKKKIKLDIEHLKHDFIDIFGSWIDIFTKDEVDFRYFAAHDYDGNKKLDGLELFVALGHESEHAEHKVDAQSFPEEIERQVDDIFSDHDTNNDGFLDYKEFLSVQRSYPDILGSDATKKESPEKKES